VRARERRTGLLLWGSTSSRVADLLAPEQRLVTDWLTSFLHESATCSFEGFCGRLRNAGGGFPVFGRKVFSLWLDSRAKLALGSTWGAPSKLPRPWWMKKACARRRKIEELAEQEEMPTAAVHQRLPGAGKRRHLTFNGLVFYLTVNQTSNGLSSSG
jgi:hypothetical protein